MPARTICRLAIGETDHPCSSTTTPAPALRIRHYSGRLPPEPPNARISRTGDRPSTPRPGTRLRRRACRALQVPRRRRPNTCADTKPGLAALGRPGAAPAGASVTGAWPFARRCRRTARCSPEQRRDQSGLRLPLGQRTPEQRLAFAAYRELSAASVNLSSERVQAYPIRLVNWLTSK